MIVNATAETRAYQREVERATNAAQRYLRVITDGNLHAIASWRAQQAVISAQREALNALAHEADRYARVIVGVLEASDPLRQADGWNQINARLKQASVNAGDLAASQQVLFDISQRTGTALSDNASLFSHAAGSMRDYGFATADILKLTEALVLGTQLSGAGAAEATLVMAQFSRAVARGVVSGDDLLSMGADGARIFTALAAGLGVTRNELKVLANDGLLTVEQVVPALVGQLGTLRLQGTLGMVPTPDGWGSVTNPMDGITASVNYDGGVLTLETRGVEGHPADIGSKVTLHILVPDADPATLPVAPELDAKASVEDDYARLKARADARLQPLQDLMDIGEGTPEIEMKILDWKRYRVALSRITGQSGYPQDIEWPDLPE